MKKILFIIWLLFFVNCKGLNTQKEDTKSFLESLTILIINLNRITLSGQAVKGIIKNGSVNISPLNSLGVCEKKNILATTDTDDLGNYSLKYNKTGKIVCVTVSGNAFGSSKMYDEKMGTDVSIPESFELVNIISESKIQAGRKKNSVISLLSRMITGRLQNLQQANGGNDDINSSLKKASKELVIRFGLNSGLSNIAGKSIKEESSAATKNIRNGSYPEYDDIPFELENPSSPLASKFISIMGGFSYLANKYKKGSNTTSEDLDSVINAFASDFEDGLFDGKTGKGNPIVIGSGTKQVTFSSTPLTSILYPAILAYFEEGGVLSIGASNKNTSTVSKAQLALLQFIDNTPIISEGSTAETTAFSYVGSPFTYNVGTPITSLIPIISAGTINSFTITPILSGGLILNSSTGAISGNPTNILPPTNFTITGISSAGSAITTISITVAAPLPKRIFVTTSMFYTGNLGGTSGADTKCMTDISKPDANIYKAMLVNGSSRRACTTANCSGGIAENTGWVLLPNQLYVRADGITPIGITNGAAIFTFPLTNSIQASGTNIWTGLAVDFTDNAPGTCSGWTTTSGNGSSATSGAMNNTSINTVASQPCGGSISLYCVQQ
jgi:hypothetical protein